MVRVTTSRASLGVLWIGLLALYFQVCSFQPLTYDSPLFLSLHPAAEFSLVSSSFWQTLFTSSTANLWHPLTDLSHQLLYRVSESPPLHLAFNVCLHGLNASLLFFLLGKLTNRTVFALIGSLLFAWHPVTVESVAWIAGRKDLLCTSFLLLAILHYHNLCSKPKAQLAPCASWPLILLFLAACLSKPIAFILPLLLLAFDFWPLQRKVSLKILLIEKWPLYLIAAASVFLTLYFQSNGTQSVDDQRSITTRGIEALWALHMSLEALIFPFHLHLAYRNPSELPLGKLILGASALMITGFLLLIFRKKAPSLVTGSAWYLIALLPTLGLIRAGNHLAADRYSYLPLMGLLIALIGLTASYESKKGRSMITALASLVAVLFLPLSFHMISQWHTQKSLFTHVLKHDPKNITANVELAALAYREGNFSLAVSKLEPVLQEVPQSPGAHLIFGHIAYEEQNYSQAYHHYGISAQTRQSEAFLQERLAASAHGMGDLAQTRAHLIAAFERQRPQDKKLQLSEKWHMLFPDRPLPSAAD